MKPELIARKVRGKHAMRTGLSDEQFEAWVERLRDERGRFVLTARRSGMSALQVGSRLNVTAERALSIERHLIYVIGSAATGNESSLEYFAEAS